MSKPNNIKKPSRKGTPGLKPKIAIVEGKVKQVWV